MTLEELMVAAAFTHGFRRRGPFEGREEYRAALIAHVETRDYAAAHELRVGRAQAEWTADDVHAFKDRLSSRYAAPRTGPPPRPLVTAWQRLGKGTADEAFFLRLAEQSLASYLQLRQDSQKPATPLLVTLLLGDGEVCFTSTGRGERLAIVRAAVRAMPVYGFIVIADALVHGIDVGPNPSSRKEEAVVAHLGTRDLSVMKVRPYRWVRGRVHWLEPRPDVDKRHVTDGGVHDPWADIFAMPEVERPQ